MVQKFRNGGTEEERRSTVVLDDRIGNINLAANTEVMTAKIRWEMKNREKRKDRPWSDGEEWIEVEKKTIYDEETNRIDFRKMKVTDLSSCRRIETPEELPDKKIEIAIASVKAKLSKVNEDYLKEYCDKMET